MLSKFFYKKPKKLVIGGFYRNPTWWFVRTQDDYGIFKKELNAYRLEKFCKKTNP